MTPDYKLVPDYILHQTAAGAQDGRFPAVALFVDTSGFTPLTTALMQHGKAGAETIANVLHTVFRPLVHLADAYGGFVTGFAGDSFKAVFPLPTAPNQPLNPVYERAVTAAWQMHRHMAQHATQRTPYGDFPFEMKVTIADGDVTWGIWQGAPADAAQHRAYYFDGNALERCLLADADAHAGDILLTDAVYRRLNPQSAPAQPHGDHWQLTHLRHTPLTPPPPVAPPPPAAGSDAFFPPSLLPPVQGEFRQVVTLFVNLQTLPHHQTVEATIFPARFFQLLHQYEGYLCRIGRIGDKDAGGTLLLFWGAPISYENDVERALTFALALRDIAPFPVRMGISTGMAYAGFVGAEAHAEYTCHGAYVNLAARQMILAEWGEIVLDTRTAALAQAEFRTEAKGVFPLKGFAQPQPVARLHGRLETAVPFYSRQLIGRTAELAALESALAPLHTGQFAGVITLVGEAGIGKSRLVHGFLDGVRQSETTTPTVYLCQANATQRHSLHPFRPLLRARFAQRRDADDAANKAAFTAELDRISAETADPTLRQELERGASFLGALLDLYWPDSLYAQLEPRLRFENTLAALKTLLVALSRQQPLILHLEDAHWLDEDSRAFIATLVRNVSDLPLALLLTTRTPLPAEWLPPETPQTKLTLTALPAAEGTQLAAAVLGERAAPSLVQTLLARTDGNPFFMEQLLLYWQESDLLASSPAGLALKDTAVEIPAAVRSVLIARLDRLVQQVKDVVQTAAVLGREFELTVLREMLHDDTALPQKVQAAEQAAIWSAITELTYLFKHALLRDAAYEMQLQTRLRQLHMLAAEAMLDLYATDLAPHYGDIAYHYEQAQVTQAAAHWYRLAGERAVKLYASAAAAVYLSRALTLTQQPEERFQLLLLREDLYHWQSNKEAQRADVAALAELAQVLDDGAPAARRRLAEATLRQARYAESVADYAGQQQYAEAAIQLAAAANDPLQQARAQMQLGKAIWPQGDYDAAIVVLEQGRDLAQAHDFHLVAADCIRYLGVIADFQSNYDEARVYQEQALQLFTQVNNREGMNGILNNMGITLLKQGRYDEARAALEEALQNHRAIGYRNGESWALGNLGFVAATQGHYDAADHYYHQALTLFQETGDMWSQGMVRGHLGNTAVRRGAYGQAQQYHTQAHDIFEQVGYRQGVGMALNGLGDLAARSGRFDAAEEMLRGAMAVYEELEVARGKMQCLVSQAYLAMTRGAPDVAQPQAEQALTIARTTGTRQVEVDALTLLGHIHAAQENWAAAMTAYESALSTRRAQQESGRTLDVLAGLARAQWALGDRAAAETAVADLLIDLAQQPPTSADEPGQVFLHAVTVLRGLNDARADALLRQGLETLQTIADGLEDESAQRAFWENVPANRALARMAGEQNP